MGWTYFRESGDLVCPSKIGLRRSPIARSMNIVEEFSSQEWNLETLSRLRSGMTFKLLMEDYLKEVSTSFTVDFHARISALQEMEKAWKESEADYFSRSCAFPKKSNPSSYFLRMSRQLQAEGDFESLKKLPKWGMIADGVLYPLQALERHIKEKDGFYLPTPNTMDHMAPRSIEAQKRVFETHRKGRTQPCNLREWILPSHWPQNLFPIPIARAGQDCPVERRTENPILERVLKIKKNSTGQKLHPHFVEWMMGYQIGWTELNPWVIPWFLTKQKKRLKS